MIGYTERGGRRHANVPAPAPERKEFKMRDQDSMVEEWCPVAGHEGNYEVSNLGRVRSLGRVVLFKSGGTRAYQGRILQGWLRRGYRRVSLKGDYVLAHVLVLEAFLCPRPAGHDACHRNGDRQDNRLSNLYWGTRKENMADAIRHGTTNRGENYGGSVLTDDLVRDLRRAYAGGGVSFKRVAEGFGLKERTVTDAVRGNRWSHVDNPPPIPPRGSDDG